MAQSNQKFGEFGKTGLPVYGGIVYDEPDKKLTREKWRSAVRDMTTSDSAIKALLFLIQMIARQAEWKIVPFAETAEDKELGEFVRQCMFDDMTQTWQDTVAEILSFIPWGWAWLEIVYKRRGGPGKDKSQNSRFSDGKVGWRKWAIRSQESLFRWEFDDWDEVVAMVQQPEPDFKIRTIPFEKSLHFRTSSHKQNPEGASILRGCYRDWYFKRHIENIEGIGIERDMAGIPKIGAPPDIFKDSASSEEKSMLQYLQNLGESIRQNETAYILYPLEYDDDGNKVFEVELLSSGGKRQFDTTKIIDRKDQRMLMTAMADFMMLGSKDTGSYALGDMKLSSFLKALKTWLDTICDTVNRHEIPRLLAYNGKSSDRAPRLECGTLEEISLDALGTYVNVLTLAGVVFSDEEKAYLKKRGNIPVDTNPTYTAVTQEVDDTDSEDAFPDAPPKEKALQKDKKK